MNFFKTIIAKLTRLEVGPVPQNPMDDPRTKILTRGPARVESGEERFRREQELESNLSRERKERAQIKESSPENQNKQL